MNERKHEPSLDVLSPRHSKLLDLVVDGKTRKEAAQELGVTNGSTRTYIAEIRQRLGRIGGSPYSIGAWYERKGGKI